MTYRIAICDDEPEQVQALKAVVDAWGKENRVRCAVACFPSAEAFWFAYEADPVCDILLLDVEMPGMSGMDLARRLRAAGSRLEIVFITSHFEFVGEGYEVDARHYLVKPVAGEKLCTVLSRAAERLAEEPPYVVFSCEGETVKLYEAEVLYAESFLHDLVIHARTGEYRIRETISSFAQRLSEDFFQTHRSYLVNLRAIVRIGRTSVTLENGAALPLARGKYDAVNHAFIARM